MNYWLVKTEPDEYSLNDLLKDGTAIWDGVRNYQARNNLKKMKKDDLVFVYHSGKVREVVGLAKISRESYQDPKDKTNGWVVVELRSEKKLNKSITLEDIKHEKKLSQMPLLKQSRLSVMPITFLEYETILAMSES